MFWIKFEFLLYSCCLIAIFSSSAKPNCPSQKNSRKIQKSRLQRLTSEDIVVEALYSGKINRQYWFIVEQTWSKNSGNLRRRDTVYIDVSNNSFRDCFKRLSWGSSCILMLRPKQPSASLYEFTAPPVVSSKKKFRQAIWNSLCAPPGRDSNSCPMRITMPERVIFYQRQIQSVECKVESSSTVTSVKWYKDEREIHTDLNVGLVVDASAKELSVVSFNQVSAMHEGTYECRVRNEAGQTASASAYVSVVGPLNEAHRACNQPNICANGGVCRMLLNGELSCLCPKTHKGERCELARVEFDAEGLGKPDQNEHEDSKTTVSNLTTAVTAIAITLAFVLGFSVIYIKRLRRKLNPKSESDEDDDDLEMTIVDQSGQKPNGTPRIEITEEVATDHIEFRPVRVASSSRTLNSSVFTLNDSLHQLTPKTPLRKSPTHHLSLQVPLNGSISSFNGTPSPRRERLKARS